MDGLHKRYITLLFFCILALYSSATEYLKIRAQKGDGITVILNRYDLAAHPCNVDTFLKINNLDKNDHLQLAKTYKLPIEVLEYNDKSIRSTINNSNYDLALYIQKYNEEMVKAELREFDYRVDKQLWVPIHATNCMTDEELKTDGDVVAVTPDLSDHEEHTEQVDDRTALRVENFPIFGADYEKTPIYTEKLKGQIYYLISGHGGPDPGAMTKKNGHVLCEDEYAYDVTLRLARNLLQHSATVYLITRDDDGIRDKEYLDPDKDETVWYDQTIPLNHVRRLKQRSNKINELYVKHKNEGAKIQRVIEVHIDSRYVEQKVDIFFYYYPGSETGKELAMEMYKTIKNEYDDHQANRGYKGVVKGRDLHTLRETRPPVVYIELGNITNDFDQKRLLIVNNRQAIANWLTLGVISKNGG
jgi:N-acetylmuramoyl-L-alanine amidase